MSFHIYIQAQTLTSKLNEQTEMCHVLQDRIVKLQRELRNSEEDSRLTNQQLITARSHFHFKAIL